MNDKIISAVDGYFETLYDLNRNLITFCGTHAFKDDRWKYHRHIQEIICAIPQIVPYVHQKSSDKYVISEKDGLSEFSDEICFLREGYNTILKDHTDFLVRIKELRNKYEHQMHCVEFRSTGGGTNQLFYLVYRTPKGTTTLYSNEFIDLVKDINVLFSEIQKEIHEYVYIRAQQYDPYCQRLLRYDFSDFNKIYDSSILHIVGKAFLPF